MKIVNLDGEKIKACFSFIVNNSEISVSTIFNENRFEIAIFDKSSGALEKDKLTSIPEAINWVSMYGNRD